MSYQGSTFWIVYLDDSEYKVLDNWKYDRLENRDDKEWIASMASQEDAEIYAHNLNIVNQ
jgi:hypothetical protein